jgi:pimeloyl-ACP methyl ester carboxylesterase
MSNGEAGVTPSLPVSERALLFGAPRTLVGILSEQAGPAAGPAASATAAPATAAILLNAGLIHRVGPNRVYVAIARRLASEGIVTLRFDFSGIGDSLPRREPFLRSAVADARQAMDWLQAQRGIERFLLIGHCSGADIAHHTAAVDPRVTGVAVIEAFGLAVEGTLGYFLYSYRKRILQPRSWLRLLSGRSEAWTALHTASSSDAGEETQLDAGDLPAIPEIAADLAALGRRGLSMLVYNSVDSTAGYCFRVRLRRALQPLVRQGTLRVEWVGETDHTFTPIDKQARLVGMLSDWARTAVRAQPVPAA